MNIDSTSHFTLVSPTRLAAHKHGRPTKYLTHSVRLQTVCFVLLIGPLCALFAATGYSRQQDQFQATADENGTVHVPALAIPLSSYMSEKARHALILEQRESAHWASSDWRTKSTDQQRKLVDDAIRPEVERAKAMYPVNIEKQEIGGVITDVVEPKEGISPRNRDRVLISLHGGAYFYASGGLARLIEAIPVAGYGKIKVVSIDYRLSPKYKFPAAVEDVAAVYRALLTKYSPERIGIYGCSTGATLGANVIVWLEKEKLPRPGAIGLFCQGATKDDTVEGDSYYFGQALMGGRIPPPGESSSSFFGPLPYTEGADGSDPLVAPVVSLDALSKFPPTLLISGTRDFCLSSILYTHSRLIKAGIEADLHVWDGMWHGFYFDVTLPESK